MIECENNYSLDAVSRLIKSGYKSMECRQDTFDRFYENLFDMMKRRVFGAGGCRAWYNNSKGVNFTLWPSDLTHYWWVTRTCNLDEYLLK